MRVPLTLATGDYDHVRDLGDGTVQAEGIDLTWLRLPPEDIFHRFAARREWEASELSLGLYVNGIGGGDRSVGAIPVFPSRVFRHSAFYVRHDGPRTLEQLAGLRVGVPEWGQTAGVWARGVLSEHHGVELSSVTWVQGGVNAPGRSEKAAVRPPAGVTVRVEATRSLNALLLAGELDAVISARVPSGVATGEVRPLLEDPQAAERRYWRATGIFPIMHVVGIRRDVLDARPWIATSLYDALDEARRRSVARLLDGTASHVPLPWAAQSAAQAQAASGHDLWAYGVQANRSALDAFLRYAFEQGVSARRLQVDDLFVDGPTAVVV